MDANNELLNKIIDSIASSRILTTAAYKENYANFSNSSVDENLIIQGDKSQIAEAVQVSTNNYPASKTITNDEISVVQNIFDLKEDSVLTAKFNNQIAAYKLLGKDTLSSNDSNLVNSINWEFASLKVGTLRNTAANKLLVKKTQNVSMIIFWITCILLSIFAFKRNWSLIPLMGLITCLYLLTGMTLANWLWFGSWLAIGLVIYFLYGNKKSKLAS
ncbi:MAG: hypothetical protein IPP48_11930 [Chitinophagaceae bacterium]|nr:hypothetical protein [Chitinophagaceae bacterium]